MISTWSRLGWSYINPVNLTGRSIRVLGAWGVSICAGPPYDCRFVRHLSNLGRRRLEVRSDIFGFDQVSRASRSLLQLLRWLLRPMTSPTEIQEIMNGKDIIHRVGSPSSPTLSIKRRHFGLFFIIKLLNQPYPNHKNNIPCLIWVWISSNLVIKNWTRRRLVKWSSRRTYSDGVYPFSQS